ncbi:hypothetical protein KP509_03G007300 [Ceratopteris richardii]|uniref:Serine hydrolase domain-containing protein n=1 Tax=Ceratopteris richardii TaxID=49495 RepID=A0A8T2UZV2_CERRI|nr:hypothetical protein KP509_03G007300 [Ceratopteris richardii]
MEVQKQSPKSLRVLCFHGFRTSAAIFEKQIRRWDPSILELLDLTFIDGPFPASGKSDVEAIFPGPYFEWFQFNKDYSKFTNLEECKEFITNYMQEHGPYDGLMGFSQGGVLAAAFAGLQQKGLALQHHPSLRFIVLVSGTGFNNKELMHECYSELVDCPSVHIIGDQDHLKTVNEELVQKFKDPQLIRHHGKHTVPRLGEDQTKLLKEFLLRIQTSSPSAIDGVVRNDGDAKMSISPNATVDGFPNGDGAKEAFGSCLENSKEAVKA